ncbi:hypothetical protein BJ742DRAFT_278015 [Cladochytrium replicatum]|nr:hypothetical protein BJ742DRAFT_278015 [Cladochytrium replicatum]
MGDELFGYLVDTHVHIQDETTERTEIEQIKTKCICAMGVRTGDWDRVESITDPNTPANPPKVFPAFGVHPWFCQEMLKQDVEFTTISDDDSKIKKDPSVDEMLVHPTLRRLETLLMKYPNALVGEIGIDKVAKNRATGEKFPFALQMALFEAQLLLAARFNRPASIHVVRCHGVMFDLLRSAQPHRLPPRFAFHSWTGSADLVNGICKLKGVGRRAFFGFSTVVSGRSADVMERIRAVPDDRLLLESDLYGPSLVDEAMINVLSIVAQAKGWSELEAATKTFNNAEEFLTGKRGIWEAGASMFPSTKQTNRSRVPDERKAKWT